MRGVVCKDILYYFSTSNGSLIKVNLAECLADSVRGEENILKEEIIDNKTWGDLTAEGNPNIVYNIKQLETPIESSYKIYRNGTQMVETGIKVDTGYANCIVKINGSIFVAGFVYPFGKYKKINNYLQLFTKSGTFKHQYDYEINNEEDGNNDQIKLHAFLRKSTQFCFVLRKGDYMDFFAVRNNKIVPLRIAMPTKVQDEDASSHKDMLVFDRDADSIQIIILKHNCLGELKIKF